MAFDLSETDYKRIVRPEILDLITYSEDSTLNMIELDVIASIKTLLSSKFDLDTEFAKTGDQRNRNLIFCVVNIVVYRLSISLDHTTISEITKENESKCWQSLKKVFTGKLDFGLSPILDPENDNQPKPFFRLGSDTKQSFPF